MPKQKQRKSDTSKKVEKDRSLVFTKRLYDELDRIAKEVGSRKKAFALVNDAPKLVRFYFPLVPDDPEQPDLSVIRKLSDKLGEGVTTHMLSRRPTRSLLHELTLSN